MIDFREAAEFLDTGDLVLFSGTGIISNIIKAVTSSKWSHVGLVMRREDDSLYITESTTLSNVRDVDSGEFRSGVQTAPLASRLREYPGVAVGVRHVDVARQPWTLDCFRATYEKVKGAAYEAKRLQLAGAVFNWLDVVEKPDMSTVFCSELVGHYWQAMGWMRNDIPANKLTPAECSGTGGQRIDRYITFAPSLLGAVQEVDLSSV